MLQALPPKDPLAQACCLYHNKSFSLGSAIHVRLVEAHTHCQDSQDGANHRREKQEPALMSKRK